MVTRNSTDREAPPHRYLLFGLTLASDLPLPELRPGEPTAPVDVQIRLVDRPPEGSGYRFEVPDVAAYLVTEGQTIEVAPCADAPEANVRLFLLGSAMGIALHQRGILALHANAVEIDGHVVAFMGPSGVGKSTLANWFVAQGLRLVADDVCAIRVAGNVPLVLPGIPRLRLWEEALAAAGQSSDGLPLSYAGDPDYRKFDVGLPSEHSTDRPLPLAAVYLLGRGEQQRVAQMGSMAAMQALFANTYRGEYVAAAGVPEAHMSACITIAQTIPCFALSRAWGFARIDDENRALLAHARQTVAT